VELQDYFRLLRKRWVTFVVVTALCVLAALVATMLATPKYTATTQSFVSVRGSANSADLLQGSNFSQQQVKSYTELVTSPLVLDPVITTMGLDTDSAALADQITADSPSDTVLINIAVTSTSAQLAADIANAVAAEFARVVPTFEQPTNAGDSPVKITTTQQARVPAQPSSPRPAINLGLGLLVGLALGGAAAALREVVDTRIRRQRDIEDLTQTPVLGTIPFDSDIDAHPVAGISSQRGEALRRLRTNLQFTNLRAQPRTLVVTSAISGEGKTMTTLSLGVALAEAGARTLIVDADLRRPSVAEYLGLESAVGLTTVLLGRANLDDVVQSYGSSGLQVLPAGAVPPNPSEVLGSDSMAELLDKLAASYEIVLLDTPPLLPVTDAAVLAQQCSGTLVVVGSDRVRRAQLTEALASLHTVEAPVLGIVLNRAPLVKTAAGAYSYYGTQPEHAHRP
jgi:capsular exopolysaccharide synthesis family protein